MRWHDLKRSVYDRAVHLATVGVTFVILGAALHMLLSAMYYGATAIVEQGLSFFLEPPGLPGGGGGGIGPVLIGTAVIVALSTAVSSAIGVPAGLLMSEYAGTRLAKFTASAVQMIAEVPTIIVGLVVFLLLVMPMRTPSALAGAASLSVAALPYVATQVRESVSAIPLTYREAAFSLGLPRWKVVLRILVPMSSRGIVTAVLLGIMRSLGETAPVLFTAGLALRTFYGLDKPASTLSLMIFHFATTPYENWRKLAWGATFMLVVTSLALAHSVRSLSSRGVR